MRTLVVGDDLTGCNATAVRLRRLGWDAATAVRHDRLPDLRRRPVWVWNSESRVLSPEAATERICRMLTQLRTYVTEQLGESAFSDIQFAKRIDSTLRGPVAAETEAMLRNLTGPVSAVVVAAYPASGRTVEDGRLLVHGVPVDQTDLARDPFTPVTTAYLPDLLSRTSSLPVLRADPGWLVGNDVTCTYALARAAVGDTAWIICDASSDEDIKRWAAFFARWPADVLPVDPGPFTAALLAARRRLQGRVLVIGGSAMPTLSRQLDVLEAEIGVHLVPLDPCALERDRTLIASVADRLVAQARDQVVFGVRTDKACGRIRIAPHEIAAALATLAHEVLTRVPSANLYVSGGEVANEVLHRLGADALLPLVEVEPLCVLSKVMSGPWRGLRVVTKGGSVGTERVISKSVQWLAGAPGRESESREERKDGM